MRPALRFLPLAILLLFVGAVAWRLAVPRDDRVASKLEGHKLPSFSLPPATVGKAGLAAADMQGKGPRLLNIFASWCVPCIAEAPMLAELKRQGVAIDAIAVRDRPEDVARFLARHGDPFDGIGADLDSRVQIALGSSGVPETFVVDNRGVIRAQHIGPIEANDIEPLKQALAAAQ